MLEPALLLVVTDLRLHERDERLPVKSFFDAQEFTVELTRLLTSGQTP